MDEMLEILRTDMIEAFKEYAKAKPLAREKQWDFYCKARENFLKFYADVQGSTYVPLQHVLFSGH